MRTIDDVVRLDVRGTVIAVERVEAMNSARRTHLGRYPEMATAFPKAVDGVFPQGSAQDRVRVTIEAKEGNSRIEMPYDATSELALQALRAALVDEEVCVRNDDRSPGPYADEPLGIQMGPAGMIGYALLGTYLQEERSRGRVLEVLSGPLEGERYNLPALDQNSPRLRFDLNAYY